MKTSSIHVGNEITRHKHEETATTQEVRSGAGSKILRLATLAGALTLLAACGPNEETQPASPTASKLLTGLSISQTSYLPYDNGRRSMVFTPRGVTGPAPAILLLHPGGLALPDAFLNHTGLRAPAIEHGWRVIVPQASLFNGWASGAEGTDNDDVEFVRSQLQHARDQGLIEEGQPLYLAGMSSGAMMGYRLLCELPGLWAAFASVVGVPTRISMADGAETYSCDHYEPTPILAINGLADQCVTYDGAHSQGLRMVDRISVPGAFAEFSQRNGCESITSTTLSGEGWMEVAEQCSSGREVSLLTIEIAGHVWPGAPTYPTRSQCGGEQVTTPAHQIIADFFSSQP